MTVYSPYLTRQVKAGNLVDGQVKVCPNCGGKGQVFAYTPSDTPYLEKTFLHAKRHYEQTKAVWEPCWVCSKEKAINACLYESGLEDYQTFDKFATSGPLSGKAKAKQEAVKFAENPEGFITFWGSYGTGKSMLAKCIVYEAIQSGCPSYYTTAPEMVGRIRQRFSESAADVDAAIRWYCDKGLLVIDELDKLNLTDWVQETIQRIIDKRYNEQSATVLVMNVEPGKMPGYLASRINGGVVVNVPEPDMRQVIKLAKESE